MRVTVRGLPRRPDHVDAGDPQNGPELGGEFGVAVTDDEPMPAEEPVHRIGQVPGDLRHEDPVGGGRDTGHVGTPSLQVDEEQDVLRGEPERRPHFRREEVHPGDLAPLRA